MVFGAKPVRLASSFVLNRVFDKGGPSKSGLDAADRAIFSTTGDLMGRIVLPCAALNARTPKASVLLSDF